MDQQPDRLGGGLRVAATAGGAAIDITTVGVGSFYVGEQPGSVINWLLARVATLFEHRESEIAMERGNLASLPFIDRLLDDSRVTLY